MKKRISLLAILFPVTLLSFAGDSIPDNRVKRVFPAIQLGGNYTGSVKGEAAFLLGLTNRSDKQTYAMTMIMHGPSFGCEMGKYLHAFRIAPKISYEWYSSFIGARVSLVDYMDDDLHNLYISPEAGMSFGGFFNIFVGGNIPVSGEDLKDISLVRVSMNMNLLFFFFKKDK